MQSFRTELENPLVERDIIELERKIKEFRDGKIPDEKFRSLRLARGVYGQRQPGVQMVRIKLPYGKMTTAQWKRIAGVSDKYSTGNLHLTTRQDIQIHFVSLDRTPELWSELEQDNITIREACGNTVRNITASDQAGIDPDELFDVTPYAHAAFEYFLRNPICQDMGRKFKIAFSSSEKDTALIYMHDVGVIPRVREINGKQQRGFKVVIGGGLGAQPILAHTTYEFLEEDLLIPYIESILRVFDRHGERTSRHKARMKFLIQKIGIDAFNELVEAEQKALAVHRYKVDLSKFDHPVLPAEGFEPGAVTIENPFKFELWKKTNLATQKQPGYYTVYIRVPLGNIHSETSRRLIEKLKPVIADDIRVTVNQGLQLRFVKPEHIEYVYSVLDAEKLAEPGFGSTADITACPGTDTCNLAISSSTGISAALSEVIEDEFPEFLENKEVTIKISGCMNSCGQHGMASIGFHGSSLKAKGQVVPALQVLIGGATLGSGNGRIADKVIKVPSKRGPDVIRSLFTDYKANAEQSESFNDFVYRKGERYFYEVLKPLTDLTTLQSEDFIDWGQEIKFNTAIGVGECAGVVIDLIATLLLEAEEKLEYAKEAFANKAWADSIYHSYAAFIHAAKALLLQQNIQCNTQTGIIRDFDKHFVQTGQFNGYVSFDELVLQINKNEPSEAFAASYQQQANDFVKQAEQFRELQTAEEKVIS
ncbi:MAG: HEPN domain-containing protein [Bacteroidetes bacterium]|nr:HEPN domain-containing protein [Bacteroidota bacterium]